MFAKESISKLLKVLLTNQKIFNSV